jgi:hypothetical protein
MFLSKGAEENRTLAKHDGIDTLDFSGLNNALFHRRYNYICWLINQQSISLFSHIPGSRLLNNMINFLSTADAFGCKIVSNSDTTYTCTPDNSSPLYEVHVLAVYDIVNRRPPKAGDANVNIISDRKSNRSVVLVLVNYEPVNWILNISADITINEVILVSI